MSQSGHIGEEQFYILQPVFHVVELRAGDRVDMEGSFREVLEDKNHIELFKTKLNTFKRSNLYFV